MPATRPEEIHPRSPQTSLESIEEPPLPNDAHPLPYCAYPRHADLSDHGIQDFPSNLPLVDFTPGPALSQQLVCCLPGGGSGASARAGYGRSRRRFVRQARAGGSSPLPSEGAADRTYERPPR